MSSRASKSRGDRRSGISLWLEALPEGMAWRARNAGCDRIRRRLVPELARLEKRELLSTFDVTSTADDGSAGTLRQAIAEANAATSPSTIDFQLGSTPATITLTLGYSYAGDGTYASASATGLLTLSRATPAVRAIDVGGAYDGSAFSATATMTGVTGSPASQHPCWSTSPAAPRVVIRLPVPPSMSAPTPSSPTFLEARTTARRDPPQ
jgi:hypothetical protein